MRNDLPLWDRAPWHSSAAVQAFLQRAWRIEVVSFPVGAPDLNPQEHVWKSVRRRIEHNHTLDRIADRPTLLSANCAHAASRAPSLSSTVAGSSVRSLSSFAIGSTTLANLLRNVGTPTVALIDSDKPGETASKKKLEEYTFSRVILAHRARRLATGQVRLSPSRRRCQPGSCTWSA